MWRRNNPCEEKIVEIAKSFLSCYSIYMQVRTVNNIDYNFKSHTFEKKKEQHSFIEKGSVSSYSAEHVKANYMPSFKSDDAEMKKRKFLSFVYSIKLNGEPLRNQIKDTSIIEREDFDIVSWGNFLTLFDNQSENSEQTCLEKFLSKNSFQDILSSSDFNPKDVFSIITSAKDVAPDFDSKKFFKIVDFISDVDSSSYDAIERVRVLNSILCKKNTDTQTEIDEEKIQLAVRLQKILSDET